MVSRNHIHNNKLHRLATPKALQKTACAARCIYFPIPAHRAGDHGAFSGTSQHQTEADPRTGLRTPPPISCCHDSLGEQLLLTSVYGNSPLTPHFFPLLLPKPVLRNGGHHEGAYRNGAGTWLYVLKPGYIERVMLASLYGHFLLN